MHETNKVVQELLISCVTSKRVCMALMRLRMIFCSLTRLIFNNPL